MKFAMILLFALFAVAFAAPSPKAKPDILAYSPYTTPYHYSAYPYSYSNVYTYPSVYSSGYYGGYSPYAYSYGYY